jgi:hypothetical protein
MGNSLLHGNLDLGGQSPDCSGLLSSLGHNLIGSTASCTIGGVMAGNLLGANPNLGPLQANGGATPTHALPLGSPAVDAGDTATCEAVDQRDVGRPLALACDIGAFEAAFWAAVLPMIQH